MNLCGSCGESKPETEITEIHERNLCDDCLIHMGAIRKENFWFITQQFRFSFRQMFGVELPPIETRENHDS